MIINSYKTPIKKSISILPNKYNVVLSLLNVKLSEFSHVFLNLRILYVCLIGQLKKMYVTFLFIYLLLF